MLSKKLNTNISYRILAIDPGYNRIGLAVFEKNDKAENLIFSECHETDRKSPHEKRLDSIATEIKKCIELYKPKVLATEKLFFSVNKKTALLVAEARGVILSIAAENNLAVFEYSPQAIKIAVTGYGASDKQQVIDMVKRLTKTTKKIRHDDEYDAIAIGLTYLATNPVKN
jgi:crossover junction endodeoxyribonuclease RuvC